MLRRPSLFPASAAPVLCSSLPAALETAGLVFEIVLAAGENGAVTPPEWIQLTPRGKVTARDTRPMSFDPEKLAAAFTAGGIKLPIDFAHETEFATTLGAKPARGWIVAVEARAEGLFGKVEWLTDAVEALAAKAYRYISPTFWTEADRITARLLKGAALVSSPALGMPQIASPSLCTTSTGDRPMKALLAALGLTENATETEALAKLASATPDPAQFVPVSQLTAANAALTEAQDRLKAIDEAGVTAKCQALVDKGVSDGKIAPAAKDHYVKLARADFAATEAAIAAMPAVLAAGEADATKQAGKDAADGSLSPEEIAMASSLGLTNDQFKAAKAA